MPRSPALFLCLCWFLFACFTFPEKGAWRNGTTGRTHPGSLWKPLEGSMKVSVNVLEASAIPLLRFGIKTEKPYLTLRRLGERAFYHSKAMGIWNGLFTHFRHQCGKHRISALKLGLMASSQRRAAWRPNPFFRGHVIMENTINNCARCLMGSTSA